MISLLGTTLRETRTETSNYSEGLKGKTLQSSSKKKQSATTMRQLQHTVQRSVIFVKLSLVCFYINNFRDFSLRYICLPVGVYSFV